MTPKEKAKELYDKYEKIILDANADSWGIESKQCALICVDEILKLNTWVDENYQRDNPKLIDIEDTEEFWQQVKQEIESL